MYVYLSKVVVCRLRIQWNFDNEQQRGDIFKDILLVHRDFELYLLGTTLDWVKNTKLVVIKTIVKACGCRII